ncbi:MAG: peptide chain release factor N(5)-glutamine methyltransferase [Candidatus Omnitrophica bacterium]|nr:peptide chain release factor N(5)-glutamine methyltransferase [Candidatus Omnitrophota bacterium]
MVETLEIIKKTRDKVSRLDAESILAGLLGISRAQLYIYEEKIKEEVLEKFNSFAEKKASGMPLEYILGTANFMGIELTVTPDVLIPRPETELLVETTVNILNTPALPAYRSGRPAGRQYSIPNTPYLLDIGTGSGNIAIALTKFVTNCKILCSDVSGKALAVARRNAAARLVDKRLDFVLSDLFDKAPKNRFDAIVSNPPYVASSDIDGLSAEIGFEPRLALDGGEDGLQFYRRIIKDSREFLKNTGYLIFEIGFGQAGEVRQLLNRYYFKNIRLIKDFNNIYRVAVAQWIN